MWLGHRTWSRGSARHQSIGDGGSARTWAGRYVTIALWLLVVSFLISWFVSSYLGVAPASALIFKVDDGWCAVGTQSIGSHCFGDFAQVGAMFGDGRDAWSAGGPVAPYPASGWLPLWWIYQLGEELGGGTTGLWIYLVVSAACLAAPAIWVARRVASPRGALAVLLLVATAAPALATLDRGNSMALAVPWLLIFAVAYMRGEFAWVTVGVVGATLLKPQFAVLAVLLLVHRKFRLTLIAAAATATLVAASFLAFPSHFPRNLLEWPRVLLHTSDYQAVATAYPVNLGIGRSLLTVADLVGVGRALGPDRRDSLAAWLDAHGLAIDSLMLVVVVAVLWLSARRVNQLWAVAMTLLASVLTTATAFLYYSAVFIVIAALLLRDPRRTVRIADAGPWVGTLDRPAVVTGRVEAVAGWVLVVGTAGAMAPIIFPPEWLGQFLAEAWSVTDVSSVYQHLIGPVMLAILMTLLVAALTVWRRSSIAEHEDVGVTSPGVESPGQLTVEA